MMQSFGYSVVEYPGFTGFHADLNIADNIKELLLEQTWMDWKCRT